MNRSDHPLHAVLDIRDKEESAAAAAKAEKQRREQEAREQASARWQAAKPVNRLDAVLFLCNFYGPDSCRPYVCTR